MSSITSGELYNRLENSSIILEDKMITSKENTFSITYETFCLKFSIKLLDKIKPIKDVTN